MWGNLSHASMVPCLGICFQSHIVVVSQSPENEMLNKWRQSSIPSVSQIQPIFFEVAKVIQYLHSLGVMLNHYFEKDYVYLDSDNHVKVQFFSFCPNDMCKGQFDYDGFGRSSTLEDNIHQLGRLFYRVLLNDIVYKIAAIHPSEPEIPDNVWQFMQWCCAKDPKERPTIDQVVQEMEFWISLAIVHFIAIDHRRIDQENNGVEHTASANMYGLHCPKIQCFR
ncbi:hypothetical protein JOM56_011057 [Amanita muscaria]